MRFARRLWIAAACTLGLILASPAAQAQQTKLLPNDTEMVVTFNLQQILKSEVVKENKALIELAKGKIEEQLEEKGLAKYLKKADFNLFRDLSSVTFAIPGARNPEEGFILIEGNFDAEKIEAVAAEASKEAGGDLKSKMIGNVKRFEISPKDEKTMYIGILNKKTLIACATAADFAEAVARSSGTKTAKFKDATFKSLVETVNSKQSISVVATSNMLMKLADRAPEGAGGDNAKKAIDALKQLDGFSAAITIQKNIDFQLGVNTKDAETAAKYATAANLGMAFAKMQVAEKAKMNEKLAPAVDVVNSIRVTAKGSNLLISGQITADNLAKVLENIPMP